MPFGPKKGSTKPKEGFVASFESGLASAPAPRAAMSSEEADKDPPKNSPAMSGFKNLGGISGRK